MDKTTVTMSVDRYNELMKKEFSYDIMRRRLMSDSFRSDVECLLFDVPTRAEEKTDDF